MGQATIEVGLQDYAAGSVIADKYRLLYPLGKGGMGSVWAAHNGTLDVTVALKLIRTDVAGDEAPQRLLQEAQATARLADPGIVRMFDVGSTDQGDPFIVMELLSGATFRQLIDGERLEPLRAVRLLLPIVRALDAAHRAGIVHRDVKPDNIVLAVGTRGEMQPKLVDFGVAKLIAKPSYLTSVGAVVGSPIYMSPEQARGEETDHRTDLWAICAVLYEALVGEPPFSGENTHALLHAISTQSLRPTRARDMGDEVLEQIVRRGLSKKRDERWQDARELLLALAAWARAQGATQDITGVALVGRGLGRVSSVPPSPQPNRVSRSASTLVKALAQRKALAAAEPRSGRGALGNEAPTASPRGRRAAAWVTFMAALLLLAAFGMGRLLSPVRASAVARSEVPAALLRPPAVSPLPETPRAGRELTASTASTAPPQPLEPPESREPARPSASQPASPAAKPAAKIPPSSKRALAPVRTRTSPPPPQTVRRGVAPAPFKNPFD